MCINIDKRRSYVSFFLAIILTKVVFFKRAGVLGTYGIEFCLFALMLMVIIYYTIARCKERSRLENVGCIFLGIVFGLLNVSGIYMYYEKRIPFNYRNALVMVILFSGYSLLFYFISCWVFILLRWLTNSVELKSINEYRAIDLWEKHMFWVCFIVILVLWLPWIIAFYPASIEWDTYYPLGQFLGDYQKTNHHPWLYAVIVGTFYKLGVGLGDKNVGIAIYISLRNLVIAAIYSKVICYIYNKSKNIKLSILGLAFYSITPVWGAYAKHAFKDTIGAALFSLFILSTAILVDDIVGGKIQVRGIIGYSFSGFLNACFRNNGIYVVIPVTIIMSVIFIAKSIGWRRIVFLWLGVIMFLGYRYYIYNVVGVAPTPIGEALSIPFQQTARTVRDHKDELTTSEQQAIRSILDYDSLAQNYDQLISDPVKNYSHFEIEGALKSYFKNWFLMFWKFPLTYYEAFIGQSYGYYAFTPREEFGAGNYNSGMTIFNWTKDERFPDDLTCDTIPALEGMRQVLAKWAEKWDTIPILNVTNTIPVYTWFISLVGLFLIERKKGIYSIVIVAEWIMILTCMASPVNGCFRYYCPVAASTPVLLGLIYATQDKI